jgi:WD repeat-containing protein 61
MSRFHQTKRLENSHGDGLWALAWCRDHQLLTGSLEGSVKLWDVERGDTLFASSRSPFGVTSLVAFSDGTKAAACYQDSKIKFFDLVNKRELIEETMALSLGDAFSLSLSDTDDVFVSGSHSGEVKFWSMIDKDHPQIYMMKAGEKFIYSTKFNKQSLLACGAIDGATNVLDSVQQTIVHTFTDHSMPVRGLSFSADGNLLFTACDDRQVHLHDLRSKNKIFSFSHKSAAFSIDASPDSRHFVVGCQDGSVSLWDMGVMAEAKKFEGHSASAWCVGYDHDASQERFASASDDSTIQIYSGSK